MSSKALIESRFGTSEWRRVVVSEGFKRKALSDVRWDSCNFDSNTIINKPKHKWQVIEGSEMQVSDSTVIQIRNCLNIQLYAYLRSRFFSIGHILFSVLINTYMNSTPKLLSRVKASLLWLVWINTACAEEILIELMSDKQETQVRLTLSVGPTEWSARYDSRNKFVR